MFFIILGQSQKGAHKSFNFLAELQLGVTAFDFANEFVILLGIHGCLLRGTHTDYLSVLVEDCVKFGDEE